MPEKPSAGCNLADVTPGGLQHRQAFAHMTGIRPRQTQSPHDRMIAMPADSGPFSVDIASPTQSHQTEAAHHKTNIEIILISINNITKKKGFTRKTK
ncbi:hypothetical protein [Ralstonia pseudosolanacearum]|uniref:hypothetical protein n=1 Tax=Ralstonia pseudosolanacearum TaxID=1310165 RepID=UPI0018D1E0FC|nr:hypothetical protein [Ralstonia pseudosolanacearum]